MSQKIPATVATLTRNSAATLRAALESVREFDEILVCDGGSTDGTLDIARTYGARTIPQDHRYLDADGRIINFAGVRNQTLAAAAHEWFLFLDSDEHLSLALVEEIRAAVARDDAAAYWISRKYVYKGKVIDCAVTYPSAQMRFFNRAVVREFIKEVHEKIELKPDIPPRALKHAMLVPMPETVQEMKEKWLRYLIMERARRSHMSFSTWICIALREGGIAMLYLLRFMRIALFCRGTKLPVRFELARVWYQWRLIRDSFFSIR